MSLGRVKWYSMDLGYGFIIPDDGGVELLVSHDDIVDDEFKTLENNARVTYQTIWCRQGPEAKNVSKVRSPPRQSLQSINHTLARSVSKSV